MASSLCTSGLCSEVTFSVNPFLILLYKIASLHLRFPDSSLFYFFPSHLSLLDILYVLLVYFFIVRFSIWKISSKRAKDLVCCAHYCILSIYRCSINVLNVYINYRCLTNLCPMCEWTKGWVPGSRRGSPALSESKCQHPDATARRIKQAQHVNQKAVHRSLGALTTRTDPCPSPFPMQSSPQILTSRHPAAIGLLSSPFALALCRREPRLKQGKSPNPRDPPLTHSPIPCQITSGSGAGGSRCPRLRAA